MRARRPAFAILAGSLLAACASGPETSPADMKATFNAGLKAYDAGDYPTAYKTWVTIDDVDLGAMRNVAVMLRTGKGVAKDPKAAQAMMQRAAEAGLFTAQADLADMLIKGEAGPPNPKAALPWLILAAQQGHPMAQFELGQLYEQGTVIPQDLNAARKLYEAAAAGGVDEAKARLDALGPSAAPAPPTAAGH
ncbi:MAG: sel1 repeat family protein [Alphaproteobacteria bacterium]|nr:sel1 repeat family protein [Alphaproteobacteria bacterium]